MFVDLCGLLIVEWTDFHNTMKWQNDTELSEHPDTDLSEHPDTDLSEHPSTDLSEHPDMEVRGKVCP